MKKRGITICYSVVSLLVIGGLYGMWYHWTGIGIPCLFYQITGKYCPGCGITRMATHLLRLDIKAAFYSNMAVFLMIPIGIVIVIRWTLGYILYGKRNFTKAEEWLFILISILLIIFGILRNINGFEILAPQ